MGLFPWWGILLSWAFELLLLVAAIVVPAKLASMRPYEPPPKPKYDIIYYSGNELPRTEDVGGAEAGRSGRSGGREAHHPTQTIRVARGSTLRETVADAPKLDLPKSNSAVANLLALKALPGPAPAEGMRSSLRAPVLTSNGSRAGSSGPRPVAGRAPVERGSRTAQRGGAATRSLHSSRARIECRASGPAASFGPGADDQSESATRHAGAECGRATAHHDSRGGDDGTGLWARRIAEAGGSAARAGRNDSAERRNISGLGSASVVPPTVQLGAGSAQRSMAGGLGSGTATAIVPPPPSVSGGGSLTGHGTGNRGAGLGGPLDAGLAAAPPSSNGGGSTSGVVVSSQPGSKVGLPGSGGSGALAMSPSGGDKAGLGGSGGGGGIGRGDGPGQRLLRPGRRRRQGRHRSRI